MKCSPVLPTGSTARLDDSELYAPEDTIVRHTLQLQTFWKGCGLLLAALLVMIGVPQQAAAVNLDQPVPFIEAIGPVAVVPGGWRSPISTVMANSTLRLQLLALEDCNS
jgi:hypothetical protein